MLYYLLIKLKGSKIPFIEKHDKECTALLQIWLNVPEDAKPLYEFILKSGMQIGYGREVGREYLISSATD